jgi:uncharacterized protein YdaU (DUF1376 family)
MRHFQHHIGDYAAATAHLSFLEDAAYHRMLRRYYQDERPLPPDIGAVCRLIGCRTLQDRKAAEAVLREFFELRDDGWHQFRADKEINEYKAKAIAGRKGANSRWHGSGVASANSTDMAPTMPTMNHEPLTINQEEEREDNSTSRKPLSADTRGTRLAEDWKPSAEDRAFAADLGLDPDQTADEFRDFWTALPGARGRKLNWSKTFRNRCRELAKPPRYSQPVETWDQRRIRLGLEAIRQATPKNDRH